MTRWRRLALILSLSLLPLMSLGQDDAQAHDTVDCSGPNKQLYKDATFVERNVKTKYGTADYVYHTVLGIDRNGNQTRITPVHFGGVHGLETAYSPQSPYGHIYYADMGILHWISDPCGGPDSYAYSANVGCARESDFAKTGCLFDAWVGLQTQDVFGGGWDTTWGLSHRKNASSRASCYADGTPHQLPDYSYNVRTWLYLDGTFTAPSPDWPFNSRKSTSKEMLTGESHTYSLGPCWPDWCDAADPPNNNPSVVFDSCITV